MTSVHRSLGAALVLTVSVAGCTSAGPTENRDARSDTAPSISAPTDPTTTSEKFEIYTHCGIESARIRGVWWHARPPLYNKTRSGPPPGWGDPSQTGTLTLTADDRAVFTAVGRQVVFVPAPDNRPVRLCD